MEQAVDEGIKFLTEQVDEIPWSGTVIMVKGTKVYINRGEREGVSKGQVFNIGKAEILRDPDTGEVLDYSMETIGKIEVITSKPKMAICKIKSGTGIQKGMTVGLPD